METYSIFHFSCSSLVICYIQSIILTCFKLFSEVIVITTKEVQKMMSTDQKIKMEVKMKLDVVCIQEDGDMGTADALRHIQPKIKVCVFVLTWGDKSVTTKVMPVIYNSESSFKSFLRILIYVI